MRDARALRKVAAWIGRKHLAFSNFVDKYRKRFEWTDGVDGALIGS